MPADAAPANPADAAVLRQAVAADIPGIQRVRHAVTENRLVSRVIGDAEVLAAIRDTGRGWVVVRGAEVLGFAIGNRVDGVVWALFVHPAHAGQGHGRALHDTMLQWLWSTGLARLWLSTDPGTRAEAFYRRAGWQPLGLTAHGEMAFEKLA